MPELFEEPDIDFDTFEVRHASSESAAPAEAETAAVETPEPTETAPETERPRDEQGRFVAVEEEPAPPPTEPERLYAGKYRSPEELEQAYEHMQQLQGRWKPEMDALQEQIAQLGQQVQTPRTTFNLNELYEEDPASAADAALAAGDQGSYQRVLQAWSSEDPGAARQYVSIQAARYEAWQARQEAQQLREQTSQQSYGNALEVAWKQVEREIPELESLREVMAAEAEAAQQVAGEPIYTPLLESGDPAKIAYAIRTLANNARERMTDTQRARAAELARTHAAETVRAKAEAIVASATTTAPDPPQPKSYGDSFLEELQADDQARADGFRVEHY